MGRVIRSEAADGEPVLVMGDFNFDARNLSEVRRHRAELNKETGRSAVLVDIVASSHSGDHPSTYAWTTQSNALAEPFLTTTEHDGEQCLDHVYFWPKESMSAATGDEPLIEQETFAVTVSQPTARVDDCLYVGPTNRYGERPSHVSDHRGWSVEMDITWPCATSVSSPATACGNSPPCCASADQVEASDVSTATPSVLDDSITTSSSSDSLTLIPSRDCGDKGRTNARPARRRTLRALAGCFSPSEVMVGQPRQPETMVAQPHRQAPLTYSLKQHGSVSNR